MSVVSGINPPNRSSGVSALNVKSCKAPSKDTVYPDSGKREASNDRETECSVTDSEIGTRGSIGAVR